MKSLRYLDNHPIVLRLQQGLLGRRRQRRRWFGAILNLEATEEGFEDVTTARLFQRRAAHLACCTERERDLKKSTPLLGSAECSSSTVQR